MLTAPAGDTLSGEVRVADGPGDMPVGFWVLVGSTNDILHSKPEVEHDKFTLVAPRGPHHGHDNVSTPSEYKLCVFQRKPVKGGAPDDVRNVLVRFDAAADPDAIEAFGEANSVTKGLALQKDVNEMQTVVTKVERTVGAIIEEIDTIRNREQVMFDISTGVAQQIWLMGIVSCVAIVAAGYLQLHQMHGELKLHSEKMLADGSRAKSRGRRKPAPRRSGVQMRRSLGSLGSFGRLASFAEGEGQVLPRHTNLSPGLSVNKVKTEKAVPRSRPPT